MMSSNFVADMYTSQRAQRGENDIDSNTCFSAKRRRFDDEQREQLRQELSPENIARMSNLRDQMNSQILLWALFSFNNVHNGSGGVYEILEGDEIIYISGIPKGAHVRDALNTHFSGEDELKIGQYLLAKSGPAWRNFYVRFMQSDTPRIDSRLLLRHFQLEQNGCLPRFN